LYFRENLSCEVSRTASRLFFAKSQKFQTAAAPVLYNILKKDAPKDWRKVLKETTGEDISTRAMMQYFKPLMSWLEEQNKGRQIGWE
jgi:angiotensin-converting enzyme